MFQGTLCKYEQNGREIKASTIIKKKKIPTALSTHLDNDNLTRHISLKITKLKESLIIWL